MRSIRRLLSKSTLGHSRLLWNIDPTVLHLPFFLFPGVRRPFRQSTKVTRIRYNLQPLTFPIILYVLFELFLRVWYSIGSNND